jgi:hypothetical protein
MKLVVDSPGDFLTNRMPHVSLATFGENAVLVGAAAIAYRPPEHLLRIQGLNCMGK